MVVIIIIGILAALGYASLIEMIFTNRAKESAQTMRTFAERALAEGKRMDKEVEIELKNNNITYTVTGNPQVNEALSNGFINKDEVPDCEEINSTAFRNKVTSQPRIGISGIDGEGYFVACGGRGYCAAAVKVMSKNSFVACIKRGNSAKKWEAL